MSSIQASARRPSTTISNEQHPSLRDYLLAAWWKKRLPGFLTLRRLVTHSSAGAGLRFRTRDRCSFLLYPPDYIDSILIREGFYESEVFKALGSHAENGAVVWDVGANFGLHCATLGRLRPDLRIVAFEPNPREHARLLRHREWNAPNVQTCAVALSDRRAYLPLHLGPAGNSGMTTLSPWSEATYSGTVMVAAARGDDLIAEGLFPAPQVIKIDVEGHEAAVLRGLEQTLHGSACRAVILEDGISDDTEPKHLLRSAGFEICVLTRNERTDHALANFVARKPKAA